MAIARDTNSTTKTAGANTLTYAYTCTGNNRILFVTAQVRNSSQSVTSITYAGVAMTKISSAFTYSSFGEYELWYLKSPATGSNNVVITASAGTVFIGSYAASYTGVDTINPIDNSGLGGQSTTSSYSQSLTTSVDNCWGFWYVFTSNSNLMTSGTNTSILGQDQSTQFVGICDTNSAKTPAGVDTMNVTSSSQVFNAIMVTFKPVQPIVNSSFLAFM